MELGSNRKKKHEVTVEKSITKDLFNGNNKEGNSVADMNKCTNAASEITRNV